MIIGSWSSVGAQKKATLTFWGWGSGELRFFPETVNPIFEVLNPGAKLEVVEMGFGDLQDKFLTATVAGVGQPDLVVVPFDILPGYVEMGGVADLTQMAKKYSAFFPAGYWALSSYKGKSYGLPWVGGPSALYYRKDIFDKSGVGNPPETWDDYVEIGKKVTKDLDGDGQMDQYMSDFPSDTGWGIGYIYTMLIWSRGGQVFDEAGQPVLTDRLAVDTMRWYTDIMTKHKIAAVEEYFSPAQFSKIGSNRYASYYHAVWWQEFLRDKAAPKQEGLWRIAPYPHWERGKPVSGNNGGGSLAIGIQSKNKELAFEAMRLITATDGGALRSFTFNWPLYIPVYNHPLFGGADDYFGGQEIAKVFAQSAELVVPGFRHTQDSPASFTALKHAAGAIIRGEMTVEAAMKAAQDEVLSLMK